MTGLKRRTGFILLGIVMSATCSVACEYRSELAPFEPCILGGIESVRLGEAKVELECPVPVGMVLVGMPGRRVTIDEIVATGLSKNLAEVLVGEGKPLDRWCTVNEYDSKLRATDPNVSEIPIAKSECGSTELEIRQIVHTRSSKVRVTLVRSPSGKAILDGFEPL